MIYGHSTPSHRVFGGCSPEGMGTTAHGIVWAILGSFLAWTAALLPSSKMQRAKSARMDTKLAKISDPTEIFREIHSSATPPPRTEDWRYWKWPILAPPRERGRRPFRSALFTVHKLKLMTICKMLISCILPLSVIHLRFQFLLTRRGAFSGSAGGHSRRSIDEKSHRKKKTVFRGWFSAKLSASTRATQTGAIWTSTFDWCAPFRQVDKVLASNSSSSLRLSV